MAEAPGDFQEGEIVSLGNQDGYAPYFDGNNSRHYAEVIMDLMPKYRTRMGV